MTENSGSSLGRLPQSSSTVNRLTREFDAKTLVSAAIRSHNPHDFSGPELPSGLSVDSHALSDEMPRELGIHSLSRVAESGAVPPGTLRAQMEADEVLLSRLPEVGLTVVPNSGVGNLCLLQAMKQTAGVPREEVDQQAFEAHAELTQHDDALGLALQAGQGLYTDRHVLQALAEHIFGAGNVPPILIMTAGEHGSPLLYAPLADHAGGAVDLATVSERTAVFLDTPGHFQAVANTSGRPLSTVLRQLQMVPGEPQVVGRAAWLRHAIRAADLMRIQTIDAAGAIQLHEWKRGVQTGLTVLDRGEQALEPLMQAREMAEAQDLVNDFWAALQEVSFDLGRTPSDDGGQVHRLGVSPMEDYVAALPKVLNVVSLTLQEDEPAHQYIGEFQVRQGWISRLTVRSCGEGDVVVEYARPMTTDEMARALAQRLPRKDREGNVAWARRLYKNDAQVRALDYEERIALLAAVTSARPKSLRAQPALQDTPAALAAQALAQRLPRHDGEANAAWARRLYDNDEQVRAMGYDERIALLAAVTSATPGDLRKEPALQDALAALAAPAQALAQRLPRRVREGATTWARRLYENDEQVRAMGYDERIALLAAVTSARPANLRADPALQDTPAALAAPAQALAQQLPRHARECNTIWARRLYKNNEQVRAMGYDERIALLAAVTSASRGTLRADPALQDTPAALAAQAQALAQRLPRQAREGATTWARRLYKNDAQVRALDYDERIALLAAVTSARPANLRADPALRETPAELAAQAQALEQRLPRHDGEANAVWARRLYKNDEQVRAMDYGERIALLAAVTSARPGDLRAEPALRETPAALAAPGQALAQRLPRRDGEANAVWARRLYENDAQVRAMGYEERIALLAAVTSATPASLRKEAALKDMPA